MSPLKKERTGLRLNFLGGFEVRLASGPAVTLPTRKAQALLVYLAVRPGHTHPRDKLAALLWPDRGDAQARDSLRHTLVDLRKVFADRSPGLIAEGHGVALDSAAVEVDIVRFEALVKAASTDDLAKAAEIYQGDFLEGFVLREPPFEEWLVAERERLRELALGALQRLLEQQARARASEPAIRTALRLLALDATQEVAHRALMRLYVQQGRRAAALRQYQTCVAVLQRELAAEPEVETRQLYQEIVRRRDEVQRHEEPAGARVNSTKSPAAPASPAPVVAGRAEPGPAETPLIGRSTELATLVNTFAEAQWRHGRVVAIVGEAGVGKSRLVAEQARRAAEHDARVLIGRCYESEQILPFGPWVDALRAGQVVPEDRALLALEPAWRAELARLFPEIAVAGLPRASDDARRLFESITRLVGALSANQPVLLVLEDLHWADEMSLRLLSFLGRRVHAWPVLVVATAREEEIVDVEALRRALAELRGEGHFAELVLSPLSRSDTSALVRSLTVAGSESQTVARFEEQAWAASEGNPFVVVEMVRALGEGTALEAPANLSVPGRVREVIARRLERLSDRSRQLLSVAAVIGREFDFALLCRASGLTDRDAAASVEDLVRRRMLHGVHDGFDFTHDRIREVVYSGLLPPRRKLLHGDVAAALEALSAGALDPPAAALGMHYRNADVWDKAALYFRHAGLKALARSSNREASAHFEQALMALTHLTETRETLEQAIDLRFDLRTSLFPLGEVPRVLAYLQEAEPLARTLDDQRRMGRLSVYMSHILHVTGRPNEGREFGERARVIGEALGDLSVKVGGAFYTGASCYFSGDYEGALDLLRETVRCLEGDLGRDRYGLVGLPAVMARAYLAWVHAERGEFEAALAHGRDGIRLAEAVEHPYSLIIACWGLLYVHVVRQELEQAEQVSERALALAREWDLPLPSAITWGIMGHAYAVAGRIAESLAFLEASVRLHETSGLVYYHSLIVAYLAEASLLADRRDDAFAFGEQALRRARERGERGFEAWCLRSLGEIAAHADPSHVDHAQRRYQEALALATERGMRPLAAHCHVGLGKIYGHMNQPEQAREHLSTAATMFREMDMRFWLQQTEAVLREVT